MSARSRKGEARARGAASGASRGASSPRSARRGGGTFMVLVPLVLIALALVMIRLALVQQRATGTRGPDAGRMDPEAAYLKAVRVSQQRDWLSSLPYYRRAIEGAPSRQWRVHFNYGLVLSNITLQFVVRAGQQVTLTRSSADRIRYGRAALDEYWAAVQLAPDGATRAKILALRANMMVLWGFPWEAFASYRAASHEDSTRADLVQRGDQFLTLMHDPTKFKFVQPDSTMRLAAP